MKKLCLGVVLLGVCAAMANGETITMTTNNQIKCASPPATINLTSWQWGSAAQINPANGLVAKINLSQVVLTKTFDGCTSNMLNAYFDNKKLSTVVIEQTKVVSGSTVIVAEVTLTNAFFSNYNVGGSTTSPASESWALSFDKICVATYPGSANSQTVCYSGAS
jgi:type VI protein secretion system component Hcp